MGNQVANLVGPGAKVPLRSRPAGSIRAVRGFLLPEAELRLRQQGGVDCKSGCTDARRTAGEQIRLNEETAATGKGVGVGLTENNEEGDGPKCGAIPFIITFLSGRKARRKIC